MARDGGAGTEALGTVVRWSGEQVADATRGAKKADVEQILDSLPAPLQPPATSSGSSEPSDSVDLSAFRRTATSDGWGIHVADRPTTREATHRRRPIAVGRFGWFGRSHRQFGWGFLLTCVKHKRGSTPLGIGQRLTRGTKIDGFGGGLKMGVADATSCRIPCQACR